MERISAFRQLRGNGMDYVSYRSRSERQKGRMDAVEKAIPELLERYRDVIEYINYPMSVLFLGENWCSDSANAIPVVAKLAEICNNWDFAIVPSDENKELMTKYYTTAGKRKIPVVVFATKEGEEIARWSERAEVTYKLLVEMRAKYGDDWRKPFKEHPDYNIPNVTEHILKEILQVASKSVSMLRSISSH